MSVGAEKSCRCCLTLDCAQATMPDWNTKETVAKITHKHDDHPGIRSLLMGYYLLSLWEMVQYLPWLALDLGSRVEFAILY